MIKTHAEITDTEPGTIIEMPLGADAHQPYVVLGFNDYSHKPEMQEYFNARGNYGTITMRKPNGKVQYSVQVGKIDGQMIARTFDIVRVPGNFS